MWMILLLVFAAWAAELKEEDGFRLNDVGVTVWLPPGWTSKSWADWELVAESPDPVEGKVWMRPFQVDVTEENVATWAEVYAETVDSPAFTNVEVASKGVTEIAGRPTGTVRLTFTINGKVPGVGLFRVFTGAGHTVHLRVMAARAREARAEAALDWILQNLRVDSSPMSVEGPELSTTAGFGATVPKGWRAPLRPEMDEVRKITAKVGEEALAPDDCWVAIRPPAQGEPDVIFACESQVFLGPLDEHSYEGVEKEIHARFFGRAATPVPQGEAVQMGDRMGLFYRTPVSSPVTRMALAPYDKGLMVMWGLGNRLDADAMDAAMQAIFPTVVYTGPNGGRPIIGFDKRVGYLLRYRTFSPMVLCPLIGILLFVVAFAAVARGAASRRNQYDDI